MILGFKILPQGQKLHFLFLFSFSFFFLTNSFTAQDSLSFYIFYCNRMAWRKDAGIRYSGNVWWMEGRQDKVFQERLVEERMPAQGTPGTSNGGKYIGTRYYRNIRWRCNGAKQIGSSVLESGSVFVEMFVDGVVY
jgi:hypothetical protein